MVISIETWSQNVTNRKVWDDFRPWVYTRANAECTYLWRDFLVRVVGAPWYAGVAAGVGTPGSHAFQLWTQFGQRGNNDNSSAPQYLDRIPRAQGGRRGDGIIWQPHSGWTYSDGHVAVLDEVLPDGSMRVWSQNAPYGEVTRHEVLSGVAVQGIYGFLRPKTLVPGTPSNPTDPTPNPSIPEEDPKMYVIRNTTTGNVYTVGKQYIRHEVSSESALLIAKLTSAEDVVVQLSAQQFTWVLDAFAIPRTRPELVLGGKFWSREQEVLDQLSGSGNRGVGSTIPA